MQKNLYFTSPNQPHFIEINNNFSEKKEYRIYFEGETLNLFLLEGVSITNYDTFDNGYVLTVDEGESRYLEIYPKCGDVSIDAYVDCIIESADQDFTDINRLNLALRKERFGKNVPLYSTFEKKFKEFEKEEYETYALQNINPLLSGNVKLRIDSKNKLYFTLFDEVTESNNDKLYSRVVKNGSDYLNELTKFFKDLERKTDSFYENIVVENYNSRDGASLKSQIRDDIYSAGAYNIPSETHKEKFAIFAPLYLENKIPSKFVIFKREKVNDLKNSELFKDLTIVKSFDLSKNSELGKFIDRTKETINFEKPHVKSVINDNSVLLEITGMDPEASSIATVYEDITDYAFKESTILDFESYVTDTYKRRKLVSHRILNLEFLFDDDLEENEMYSYFGMYVDDLDISKYELDLNHYGKDVYNKCTLGIGSSVDSLKVSTQIPDISKYINTNDRIFYLKDASNNFHNLKSTSEYEFKLKNSTSICDFAKNVDEQVVIKDSDIIKDAKPYVNVSFDDNIYSNTQLVITQNTNKYEIDFIEDVVTVDYYEHSQIENIFPITLIDDNTIQIEEYVYIPDSEIVTLIDPSSEISVESSYSINSGSYTQIVFSDAIDLSSITHIKIIEKPKLKAEVTLGVNLEETLAKLVEKVSLLDNFPFEIVQEANEIFICSTNSLKFNVTLDTTNSSTDLSKIKRFSNDLTLTASTVGGVTVTSNVSSFNSVNLTNDYLYPIDSYYSEYFNEGDYLYDIGSVHSESLPIDETSYTIRYMNGLEVIKLPKEKTIKKIYKPSSLCLGLFSFYDVRRFDTQMVTNDFNFIKAEYQKLYKKFAPSEKLVPRMIYKLKNVGSIPITVSVRYGIEDSWKHTEVTRLTVGANSTRQFSTFLSDYSLTEYNEDIEFRYFLVDDNELSGNIYAYNLNLFEDPDLLNFDPEFPNTSYDSKKKQNEIDIQKQNENPDFVYYQDARSEYFRLEEYSNVDSTIEDIISNRNVKWTDYKFKDSKAQPHRLNFSPALGKTGYMSTFTNFESLPELHPHEWFMMEEFPSHLSVYEGSEGNYLFSRVSKSLLLDTNYDYFTEYFSNGHLGVDEISGKDLKISRKDNYGIFYRSSLDEYEVPYKGVKYRFKSETDLSGYKFAIVHSTRPDLESNTQSIIDHCEVPDVGYDCKDLGILPKLQYAIDDLVLGDQTVNISVSVINSGTSVTIPELTSTTVENSGSLFTLGQFGTELLNALNKWKAAFENIYNTSNGYGGNLTIAFSTKTENGNYPVGEFYITDDQKTTSKIGDIRIGMAKIPDTDVAKTLYISQSDFNSKFDYVTPSIIINSNAILRKNDDVAPEAFSLSYIMAHELGHAFGLGHVDREASLMKPTIQFSYDLGNIENEDDCIISIYGEPLPVEDNSVDFDCSLSRFRKKDSFEFIVNETFKTITLKICVDVPNYINLDSKKSFVDMYVSNSLKRIASYDGVHTLEGLDLSIPIIDLSIKNVVLENDNVYAFAKQHLDLFTNGENSEYSSYRIRDVKNNENDFTIDYLALTYTNVNYTLKKSFDKTGSVNKALLTRIKDGYDSSLNMKIPLLTKEYFEDSYFYRILGGDSISKANYKLTLDYLSAISEEIPIEGSDITFDFDILPLKNVRLENIKIPVLKNKEDGPHFKLEEAQVNTSLLRAEGEYDPMTDKLTYFSLREDYNLSTLFQIDFYKLNTKFLWNHLNFAKHEELIKKMGPSDQLKQNIKENEFSMYQKTQKFANNLKTLYSSVLDQDSYSYYSNTNEQKLSGFFDPLLNRNYFNSQLINSSTEIDLNILSKHVTFNQVKEQLTVNVNVKEALRDELLSLILPYYERIYPLSIEAKIEDSLKRLIFNDLENLYSVDSINILSKDSIETTYVNIFENDMIRDSNFNVEDTSKEIIELKRPLEKGRKLKFNIKISFKYI
jgi:hypothetical protein